MSPPPLPVRYIKGLYRGYMPLNLPQHQKRSKIKPWWKVIGKPVVTMYPKKYPEGYSEKPEYPAINDATPHGLKSKVRYDWYNHLRSIPTVDGKMHEVNKHCEHYIGQIHNWLPNYNSLPMIQYMTNTRMINDLPARYQVLGEVASGTDKVNRLMGDVQRLVLDQIALDKHQCIHKEPDYLPKPQRHALTRTQIPTRLVNNIFKSVKKVLALETNPELSQYQCDVNPAIESWWYHSGFPPPRTKQFYKSRKDDNGLINQMLQMSCSAALNLRGESFIEPIVDLDDPLVTEKDVIKPYSFHLKDYKVRFDFNNPVSLIGQWFTQDQRNNFPHTTLLDTHSLNLRTLKSYKLPLAVDDKEEHLTGQAVLTAFGLNNSMAYYHGFTPFDEVEYPFTSQVITTDGQNWLFNVYQMNCHAFHRDFGGPSRNNICWTSGLMQLYSDFDAATGKFTEINQEVIRLLMSFLSQRTSPEYTCQLNLMPLLGEENREPKEIEFQRSVLRKKLEQRKSPWLRHQWRVPLFEKIFFQFKPSRHTIKEVKPQWHIPKPQYPKIFE